MIRNSFALALLLALAGVASAQDAETSTEAVETSETETPSDVTPEATAEAGAAEGDDVDPTDPTQSGLLSDDQALTEEQLGREEVRSGTDPYEDPTRAYYFLGASYQHAFTPDFLMAPFLEDRTATNNPHFGLEFTYRKDGFDVITGINYRQFHVDGPFRANGDPEQDTEWIASDLSALMVTGTFLWGTDFNDMFSLQYGLGVGVGYVFGNIVRTEAYRNGSGDWAPCTGPNTPDPRFCEATGGHYNEEADTWFDGGSTPNFWFRFAPQIGVRFKPIKQIVVRVDGGFDLFSGFFVGGALSFGIGSN